MKSHLLFLLFPLLLLAACRPSKNAQKMTVGPLTLSTDKPGQGEKISIQYQADSGSLAGEKDINAALYYAVKHNIYAQDIPISDSGKTRTGSFLLPDSAQAFALKFTSGEKTDDNNGRGYLFPVYDRSGKPIAGALAAESGFYYGQGNYMLYIESNPDTALHLLREDIARHPEIKQDWLNNYLRTLLVVKKDSAYPEIQKELEKMLSADSLTEGKYMTAVNFYRRMEMTGAYDSLTQVIKQKFPKGKLVRNEKLRAISRLKNTDSMISEYNKFHAEFPGSIDKTKQIGNTIITPLEAAVMYRIAEAYAARKQYDKYRQWAAMSNDSMALQGKYNSMARKLAQSGHDLDFADSLSKASLAILQEQIDHPALNKPDYYTLTRWKKSLQREYGKNADTYAMILAGQGKYKDALAYQKQAVDDLNGEDPDVNERYCEYLMKNGDYTAAQKEIEKLYEKGNATSQMTAYLKAAYVKQKGSDAGYPDYLAGLEAKAEAVVKEKLRKNMIDEPAATFDLPDLQGGNVSLAGLSGKVVILDFWATWCGPCKASFPGMQKAVTQFKDDSNVVFLFVNTWENTKPDVREKEVARFIDQHDYTFHVLMDQRQESDSTQYQVVSDYGVEGIPTKFIIDPQGHVRFKRVGFDGNTDKEAREVAIMIDMLKG